MKTARVAFCLLMLSGTMALASVPAEPLHPLSGAAGLNLRVTAEIKNATVAEAAEKLSSVLGGQIRLYDGLTASSGYYTLDRIRRASLVWKDAPVGQVVRDFGRAYHCILRPSDRRTYGLWPWRPPLGPVSRSRGYQFEVDRAFYQEPSSNLGLALSVHSEAGDAAAVGGLGPLRIVDEQGRVIERSGNFPPSDHQGVYPDERVLSCSVRWEQPAPSRLRAIEGTVQVFRKVRRLSVEVPFPTAAEKEGAAEAQSMRVRINDIRFRSSRPPQGPGAGFDPGGFRAHIRVSGPPGLSVEVAGKPPFGEAVFADGSRALVDARLVHWDPSDGTPDQRSYLRGDLFSDSGPDRRPVRLVLPLVVRSEPGKAIPFRIENVAVEPGRSKP